MADIREFKINTDPLFPAALPENGLLEERLEDGTVVRAKVVNSQIVGYEAFDLGGKQIPVTRMSLAVSNSTQLQPQSGPIHCYYCICNPRCQCWPEPCPIV